MTTIMIVMKRWHGMREWSGMEAELVEEGDFILGRWESQCHRFGRDVGLVCLKDYRKTNMASRVTNISISC